MAENQVDKLLKQAEQHRGKQEYDQAIQVYIESSKLVESDESTEHILRGICEIADIFAKTKRYEKAVNAYQNVLSIDPRYPQAIYEIANIHFELGNYEKAVQSYIKYFREAKLDEYAEYALVLDKICAIGDIFTKVKAYKKAINIYQNILELDPDYERAFYKIEEAKTADELLMEQQAELEEAKRLAYLGTMATAVAHEISQPVGIIRAATGAALEDIKENLFQSEEVDPLLRDIWDQTERLHAIIENFRIFARGDRTRREEVNINHVVEQISKLFAEQFKHRNINLVIHLHENQPPPIVYANLFQLEEVLINLLTNARDAVEGQDHATVWVKTWRHQGCGFSVEDNGSGLSSEYRKNMFVPFVSTKTTEKGTGLGLYISRKIVNNFDGKLCYEDRPGGGARFLVSFPSIEK